MKKAVLFLLAMVALLIAVLILSPVKLFTNEFKDKTAQSFKAASDSVSATVSATGKVTGPQQR